MIGMILNSVTMNGTTQVIATVAAALWLLNNVHLVVTITVPRKRRTTRRPRGRHVRVSEHPRLDKLELGYKNIRVTLDFTQSAA